MSDFSDELAQDALELITEFGQEVTFTRYSGEYDPAEGEINETATTTWSGVAVPQQYRAFEIDGKNILRTDLRLLVNKTETAPQKNDFVELASGEVYRVEEIGGERVNGEFVYYDLQVRL